MLKQNEYLNFEIEYFCKNGKYCVLDFLENDLRIKNFNLYQKSLAMLVNIQKYFFLRSKYVDYIKRGDFTCFELRIQHKSNICRIIFKLNEPNKTFVILHIFIKKDQKTPAKEIDKAENHWIEYINENS